MLGTILLVALAIILLATAAAIIRWLLRRPGHLIEAGLEIADVPTERTRERATERPRERATERPRERATERPRERATEPTPGWPPPIELDLPADSMTLPPAKKLPLKPPARTPLAFAVVVPILDSSVDLEPPDDEPPSADELAPLPPELPEVEARDTAAGSAPRRLPLVSPSNGFDDMTVPDRGPHWSSSDTQPGYRAARRAAR